MSNKISLPANILDELKCTFCNEYLSCFPIYTYAEEGTVACGRCPLLQEEHPARDIAYEKVAQGIIFPCKYKSSGCLEEFTPSQLNAHEDSCHFRQYFCPLIPLGTCNWQGPVEELLHHFVDEHNSLVLNGEFKIDFGNKETVNYILRHDNNIFILHLNGNKLDDKIYISLRLLGCRVLAKKYAYQISIYRLDMEQDLVFCQDNVQCDNDMKLNKNQAIVINTNEVKEKLHNPLYAICKISVSKVDENVNEIQTDEADGQYNETIIKALECPVCFNPMVPPIYQCVAGHSLCESCKPQVNNCPTCHAGIQNTRNYLLEEMTNHFKYPCKYRDYDCKHISTAQEIKKHEAECNYGPYSCPFQDFDECKWKDKLELLFSHVRVVHDDALIEMDSVTLYTQAQNDKDIFIFYRYDEIFKLVYNCIDDYLYLTIQLIGPKCNSSNYNYEVDFVNNETNERIYFKRKCSANTHADDAFSDDYLKIPTYMISSYIKNDIIIVKYRILQLND